MAGHLSQSPFVKSFDELTRTKKRMIQYATTNGSLLSFEQRQKLDDMVNTVEKAIQYIPEEFRIERYRRK